MDEKPFKLIKTDIPEQPKTKYLYVGVDPICNVITPVPAIIIELARTHDYLLINELYDNSDIKHLWETVHAIMDRAIANVCQGIILPHNISKIVYFIFGVLHSQYSPINIFTMQKDLSNNTSLVQLS